MLVNVKKNTISFGFFVILLTFNLFISCKSTSSYQTTKIEGKKIGVTNEKGENEAIVTYVKPYSDNINKDLNSVLAYCPETQDKSKGIWQSNIGNLLAEITFELGNPVFQKRENKTIDVCLLNHGGIRAVIPKGDVTTRTAFEVMPFENSLFIVGLTGKEIKNFYKDKNNLNNILFSDNLDINAINDLSIYDCYYKFILIDKVLYKEIYKFNILYAYSESYF